MKKSNLFVCFLFIFGSIFGVELNQVTAASFPSQTGHKFVEDEIIIKYKTSKINLKSTSGKMKAASFEELNSVEDVIKIDDKNISVLKIKDGSSVEQKIAELKSSPDIEFVQPNYQYYPLSISTNDTYKNLLWGLDNTGQTVYGRLSKADADVDAPEAWSMFPQASSTSVTVAVIDSGVAYYHPDLISNMWDGSNCVGTDNFGRVITGGCNHGYDYEDNDKTPLPTEPETEDDRVHSHGTNIAGIIASKANNNLGVIGLAPNAKIMAIKTNFTTSQLIKGIQFAEDNGARIINASWGKLNYSDSALRYSDSALRTAIESFDGLFVAAAGNDYNNNDVQHFYPSDFNLANIISVAATDQNDNLASFSNYGATSVDVGAPGEYIYTTTDNLVSDFESFDDSNIPSGWVKSSGTNNWGTVVINSGFNRGLFGDYQAYTSGAYEADVNSSITSSIYNLGSSTKATISFKTVCDTEHSDNAAGDYLSLEFSSDGASFSEYYRWNEKTLDVLNNESPLSSVGTSSHIFSDLVIPEEYLSANFKLRLNWVTNSTDNNHQGCYVDYVEITKESNGNDNQYKYFSGTSASTPYVAALAALLKGYDNTLTNTEVKDIILSTGDELSALSGKTLTGRRVNAYKALSLVGDDTSISSNTYLVGTSTISNVPFGTASSTFISLIEEGRLYQTFDFSRLSNPVVSGDVLGVITRTGAVQDYTISVLPDLAVVTEVKSLYGDNYFKANEVIDFQVVFNKVVNVSSSTIYLKLNSGKSAIYKSGSGTNTLTFEYLVDAGDNYQDLSYEATSSLLAVGAIFDNDGLEVNNLLPNPETFLSSHEIIVDTNSPIGTVSLSPNRILKAGDSLELTASFNEDLATSSLPLIVLNGVSEANLNVVTQNGARELVYQYEIGAGNGTTTLAFNSGYDLAGNHLIATSSNINYFIVDNLSPELVVNYPLSNARVGSSTLISFSDTEFSSPKCSVDNLNWSNCYSASTSLAMITGFSSLSDGLFNFYLKEIDVAGNVGTTTISFIKDSLAPSVTKLGDNLSDYTITANSSIELLFSEAIVSSSKQTIQDALSNGASGQIVFNWNENNNILSIVNESAADIIFNNDVRVIEVKDLALNSAAELLLIDSVLSDDQIEPVVDSSTYITNSRSQMVITSLIRPVSVVISEGAENPTINLKSLVNGSGTGVIPEISLLSVNASNISLNIPTQTMVSINSGTWDGVLKTPVIKTVTLPTATGKTRSLSLAIKVGSDSASLSFNKAIKITFPGQANKKIATSNNGSFAEVTTVCGDNSQAWANENLGVMGDCKISVGGDLYVWTKHFTDFIVYSEEVIQSSGGGGGGGGGSATVCSLVDYSNWQGTCLNGFEYRTVVTQKPSGCYLTSTQQLSLQRSCQIIATTTPVVISEIIPEAKVLVAPEKNQDKVLENVINEASIISKHNLGDLISHLGGKENKDKEATALIKYKTIIGLDKNLDSSKKITVNNFIVYGTNSSQRLGAGERAAVINSYFQAYKKLPSNESEWLDVIKIANGRWPGERNLTAEIQAKAEFKRIYNRNPILTNNIDENAIMVIAYGLLPLQRNLNSEKVAIKTFKWVYNHAPVNALAWNLVRSIAYSGAKR